MGRIERICLCVLGAIQKQYKPLAVDADVSFEPLMLQLSENPQASLDIFCQPHHHPVWVLHLSQGDKHGINHSHPAAYCPPGRGLVVCHISEGVAPGYSV